MQTALATDDLDAIVMAGFSELELDEVASSRDACEESLHTFVRESFHVIEPGQVFQDGWHLQELCALLQGCANMRGYMPERPDVVIINEPPGTMKSLVVDVLFPAWVWAKNARKRFMTAAYGATLSTRDALRTRQLIESQWYQARWPLELSDDQNAKTRYNTNMHGWRFSTSVGGAGTGEHPDFIIIDDPTTAQQAESKAGRDEANNWFDNTVSTRLGRNPVIIIVMQRLHSEDLTGHVLAKMAGQGRRLVHVRWPMRYEKCSCKDTAPECQPDEELRCAYHKQEPTWTKDVRDRRTAEGELLWAAMFPESKVAGLELALGPYGSAGQLQQRPSPNKGGLFKREDFKFAEARPKLSRKVRLWDTAATEDGGDWTVGALVEEEWDYEITEKARTLKSTGKVFVSDIIRRQLEPAGVEDLIKATAASDGKDTPIRELREPGSAGKTVIQARAKLLKGYDYKEVLVTGSKVTMAKPFRAQVAAHNVYLVRAHWNHEFIEELVIFPNGKKDDQVDATSNGYNSVLLEEPPRKVTVSWGY